MGKHIPIEIPYMGDNDVSNSTTPSQLASWVKPLDRVPLLLALSIYETPRPALEGFAIVKNNPRVCTWVDRELKAIIVGLKGTSKGTAKQDLNDDFKIVTDSDYCNLSLVETATNLLNETFKELEKEANDSLVLNRLLDYDQPWRIIFAGHSLGGTAAFCLTQKTANSRGISFNGGASPTNPILKGPGPNSMTHYHIVGDLISSHMGDAAAMVFRIKIPGLEFGSIEPHKSGTLLKQGTAVSPTVEDKEYYKWGHKHSLFYSIVSKVLPITSFLFKLQTMKIVDDSPIPNSDRFYLQLK